MTTGEGGAITTNDEEQYELLVSLRNQGRLETSSWLMHGRLGFNYRLDDISAALGIGQVERLDEILAARAAVAARYTELLARRRRRAAARRRRGSRPLLVRLRREASAGRRSRRRRAPHATNAASQRRRTSRRSTSSRTCASATASARGCCRLGGLQRAHDGAAVPRAARRDDQEYVVELRVRYAAMDEPRQIGALAGAGLLAGLPSAGLTSEGSGNGRAGRLAR